MKLYVEDDLRCASARLRKYAFLLGAGLALCMGAYVWALVVRRETAGYLILLAGFIYALPLGMLRLYPALKYRDFVRELLRGLRREVCGSIDCIDPAVQVQDGVRVHTVQLRLEDGDTRLFYLNADKLDVFPRPGEKICLISYGRHVAGVEG